MKQLKLHKIFASLLIAAGIAVSGWTAYSFHEIAASVPSSETVERLPVIIIDAGHGDFDGGATANGVIEKDINLSVALKLRDLFVANGFEVVMTREDDQILSDDGLTSIRKKKTSDTKNRLELVKKYPDAIMLSIHQNKFEQQSSHGAQVFYGAQHESSARFGEIMQNNLVEMLQPDNTRLCKPCGKNVYLTYYSPAPSLLIECGFISNAQEAKKLVSGEYQRNIAFAIFSGTMEFLELDLAEEPE